MYCPINRVVLFAKWLNSLNFLTSILTPLTLVYTLIPTLSFTVSWLQITESDNNFYDSMYSAPSVYRPPVLSPTSPIAKILVCPDFPH